MYPKSIQRLIEKFSQLPGVGRRTASRFVFHLLRAPDDDAEELVRAIRELKEHMALCAFCFNPFEKETGKELCSVCQNPSRDRTLLCVVEKESDLETLEQTNYYKGLYFILGGQVQLLKQEELRGLRMPELRDRVLTPEKFGVPASWSEVVLATNPTAEGEATALYVERLLEPARVKVTRLGRGLPIGAELEYADEETLKNALEGRR